MKAPELSNSGGATGETTASTADVASNLVKLKEYITTYGSTRPGGNPYIGTFFKEYGKQLSVYIDYTYTDNQFRFLFDYDQNGVSFFVAFYVPLSTGTSTSISASYLKEVPLISLSGQSDFNMKSYKKEDSFTFEWSGTGFGLGKALTEDEMNEAKRIATEDVNSLFRSGLVMLDNYLSGLSLHFHLKDIGFDSYIR